MPRATTVSLALGVGCAIALAAGVARAQSPRIGPGHEAEVLGLLAPYVPGAEVAPGEKLWDVSLLPTRVRVTLRADDGSETHLVLSHPDDAPDDAPRSTSFAMTREEASPSADAAWARVEAAVRRNDHGGFWDRAEETVADANGARRSAFLRRWGETEWIPVDGLAVLLGVLLLALLLAARQLRDAPRWVGAALAGIVVAGVLVRLALSPPVFLGAWPWSRLYPHVRAVAEGRWLAALSAATGRTPYVTDVAMWTNFAYASLMPLVLFAHAGYVLRDVRAGLFAALAVALLPQHIRFSRCEDGFVASLVLTSLAFALLHGWMRDPHRVVRWACLALLPVALYPAYLLRPLNLLFAGVYAVAVLSLHPETTTRARRGLGLAVVLGVGVLAAVVFLGRNQEAVAVATRSPLSWAASALEVLLDPRLLVLDDPRRTPPVLTALAVLGGVVAWKSGERRLVLFLVGWLALFLVAHAVVVQPTMEPRYHLHLVVPFLLLAASAVPRLRAWWAERRLRPWLVLGVASLVLAPWLHLGFVEDRGYAELTEYALVRAARDHVPDDCTVLEPVGAEHAEDVRFARIGLLAGRDGLSRFRVVRVPLTGPALGGEPTVDAVLAAHPDCLYLYEGLACTVFAARGERYSGACTALRERLHARVVARRDAPVRFYDDQDRAGRTIRAQKLTFRLSRAR